MGRAVRLCEPLAIGSHGASDLTEDQGQTRNHIRAVEAEGAVPEFLKRFQMDQALAQFLLVEMRRACRVVPRITARSTVGSRGRGLRGSRPAPGRAFRR